MNQHVTSAHKEALLQNELKITKTMSERSLRKKLSKVVNVPVFSPFYYYMYMNLLLENRTNLNTPKCFVSSLDEISLVLNI